MNIPNPPHRILTLSFSPFIPSTTKEKLRSSREGLDPQVHGLARRVLGRGALEPRHPRDGAVPVPAGPLVAEVEVGHVPLGLQHGRRRVPVRVVVQRAHVEEARVEFQRDGRPVL